MMYSLAHRIYRLFVPQEDPEIIKKTYGLPDSLSLQVEMTTDGWFVVTSDELPGLMTQARSQKELLMMVNDAVLTYFDVPQRKADIVYDRLDLGGMVLQYQGRLQTQHA